ncbi:MAG TPA: DegQ family serine endoprotease [Dissulfurispiraceae bacterium]|nr:DegQ family serine endoprotease [Dissulfurispiraceae bacterium]
MQYRPLFAILSRKTLTGLAAYLLLFLSLCLVLPVPVSADISDKDATEILTKLGDAMAKIAERVTPAVVNISTTRTIKTPVNPLFNDPFFKRFFGQGHEGGQRKANSLGSGFIATSDGYIITNNHVIEGAEDILVKLADNREYKGKVIGADSRTDVAVIKINEKNLPTIPWGNSDKLKVGEIILAVGNPYGLSHTITMGIISALGRVGMGISDYENFIQTDAAINPGNSGGPLVNVKGEVVGVTNAIFSTSGGYQGIGFAIPSDMVKNVMDSIISQGKVVRGWLGVQIQPLTADLARQFGLKDDNGVLLVDVAEGGPAAKAGLKGGDVVVEYDGNKINDPYHFKNMVAETKPGKQATISIIREGNPLTVNVTIGELPVETKAAPNVEIDNALRGVAVQDLSDEYRQKMNISGKDRGVIVSDIEEDSPALGIINKGDIILEVSHKPVVSSKEYNKIVSGIESRTEVLLLIIRNGIRQYITVPAKSAD